MEEKYELTVCQVCSNKYLLPEEKAKEFNPLCVDNQIHIRFNSYGTEYCVIKGFEQKLTFLLTCLFLKEFTNLKVDLKDLESKNKKYIWDKYTERFKTTKSYLNLITLLKRYYPSLEGIHLLPMYNKKGYSNPWEQFGSLTNIYTDVIANNSDCFFINYLLSDELYLVISPVKNDADTYYAKFANKVERKNKKNKNIKKRVQLWD